MTWIFWEILDQVCGGHLGLALQQEVVVYMCTMHGRH